jgi:hypothetical protein
VRCAGRALSFARAPAPSCGHFEQDPVRVLKEAARWRARRRDGAVRPVRQWPVERVVRNGGGERSGLSAAPSSPAARSGGSTSGPLA